MNPDAQNGNLDPAYGDMYTSAKGNQDMYGGENTFGAGMVGQNYMGRGEGMSDTENEDWDKMEPPSPHEDFSRCEMRPAHQFESGATYTGQWLDNMRHG